MPLKLRISYAICVGVFLINVGVNNVLIYTQLLESNIR